MTDLIFLLFTGFIIGISGAMIPGPLTLFTVSEALKANRFAGLKIISGHIFFEFILIVTIFFGLHKFFGSKSFLFAVSIIGGLALVIMGVILLLNASRMKPLGEKTDPEFNKGLFIGGIFFSVISPGFIVWWATIGVSAMIRALLFGVIGVILLTLGHWAADILWYWSVSYAVDKGKRYLSDRSYQNIMRFLSILLVILGFYFLIKQGFGIKSLLNIS